MPLFTRPAYLAHGVAEVWLVDIDTQTVERWTASSEFPARLGVAALKLDVEELSCSHFGVSCKP